MVLLHGVLNVYVERADHLPRTMRTQFSSLFKRWVCCGLGPALYGSLDPYAVLELQGTRRLRTSVTSGETSPEWRERFEVFVADEASKLRMVVKDADLVGAEFLGQAFVDASELLDEARHTYSLDLVDQQGNAVGMRLPGSKTFHPARIHFSIRYSSVETQQAELALHPNLLRDEVPRVYFPMRAGNRVTLYHDAHQNPGPVRDILLGNGSPFCESSCWDDVYHALTSARRFILITGWSVWVHTLLKRGPACAEAVPPLGQLLLKKAGEGVKVLMLVWDDASNNLGLHPGLMATHDNETFQFFKGTAVKCVLCPRQGGSEDSIVQSFTRNSFTHHQKTIIVDAPPPARPPPNAHPHVARKRHVVSFVGGLDLCDGRYDTCEHPLFGTDGPGGPHEGDHHQPNVEGWVAERGGPREPWHDIHARIEGPAAYDVMVNFIERWSKQAGARNQRHALKIEDFGDVHFPRPLLEYLSMRTAVLGRIVSGMHASGASLRAMANPFAVRMAVIKAHDPGFVMSDPASPDSWGVQVFRSIDSDSARGFGGNQEGTYEAGLGILKGKVVDRSIQAAYVQAIRRAKRYIYIENQYFLGSSHLWDGDKDAAAVHLVPAELALKLEAKIRAREPFRVYVVLPLWPEGVPTSGSVQDILAFQARTMAMMYRRVAAAIRDSGVEAYPTDYLQFFCLGRRQPAGCYTSLGCCEGAPAAEARAAAEGGGGGGGGRRREPAQESAKQAACCASRRFMIYVHSKLMIVDDEYAIIGSANINQRSMDGSRDTEIAVGLLQAGYTLDGDGSGPLPRGQVAGFRQALLKEHIGSVLREAEDPSDLACARRLRAIGDANWVAWSRDDDCAPMPSGHLMTYPVAVAPSGAVGPLPGAETFPDLGGRVLGQRGGTLPVVLTT
ncbi:phospholipase D gamma [Raphidocelis subcapitata]|uniref:phospholipase D n=1 Tax=Raphidocelis subcapitata TaxID=307507 RepID=A0A2V0PAB2_9CHLO|nr:phospholipase D gamma [Raphidocelis subcapitata]|eukprot:GBF94843.1 phospholipase D gamma [Raphidocelis subcapitata]